MLSSLMTKGKTRLNCQLEEKMSHLLTCSGKMRLDHERLTLTLESLPEEPIEYFQDNIKLSANQAKLDYTSEERGVRPKKLLLTGQVLLSDEESSSRCALADQFCYHPEEGRMILKSTGENNVLFWDRSQDLSISAKEVHITLTEEGESIKGVGNVRFAFSSTENALLRKIFPFYKPLSNGGA